jgi:hypothetical protein
MKANMRGECIGRKGRGEEAIDEGSRIYRLRCILPMPSNGLVNLLHVNVNIWPEGI